MSPIDRDPRRRNEPARPDRRRANVARPLTAAPRAPGTGLRGLLRTIDGGPFQAYRRILGEHELGDFSVAVLSVPPDALGGPARLRLSIDRARAGLEGAWSRDELARLVIEDVIVRAAARAIEDLSGPSVGSAPGSGRVWIDPPGPELVRRTSASVGESRVTLSLAFDLPAADRRVRGQQAEAILFEHLPRVGMAALLFPLRRVNEAKKHVEEAARRRAASGSLAARGLAALVPPSALGRRSLSADARTTIETPSGPAEGLAIPTGITVFLASGVSGAGSWLCQLMSESGFPPERTAILGGRAAFLRASRREFGPLDLGAFARPCAEVPDPSRFATESAPAPLAFAASVIEAVEAGARILVVDEDVIPAGAFGPDGGVHALIGGSSPFFPLVDRLSALRDRWGLSFLIASRTMGAWSEVADSVFVLRDDRIEDVSASLSARRRVAAQTAAPASRPAPAHPGARSMRVVVGGPPANLKVAAWGDRGVRVGDDLVDLKDTTLRGDPARLRAVAALLKQAACVAPTWRPVEEVLDDLEAATEGPLFNRLEEPGLVDLAAPSRVAIASALTRWKRADFRVAAGKLAAAAEDTR